MLSTLVSAAASKLLLWEARRADATVYLLGSLHELRPDDFSVPPLVQEVFGKSEQVVFEADLDEIRSTEIVLLTVQKGTYSLPDNLAAHLSAETYGRVVSYADDHAIRLYQYNRPWLLNQIFTAKELSKDGFDADFGIDRYFFDLAEEHAKPRLFFETAAFQIETLASLPESGQITFLERFLADPARSVQQAQAIVTAWKNGDADGLWQLMADGFQRDPEMFRKLLIDRNHNWLPRIEEWLGINKTTLVVVGAGHLVGEHGLVTLMQSKGYIVEQLPKDSGPNFVSIELAGANEVRLSLQIETAGNYTLERSTNLSAWTEIHSFEATNSVLILTNVLESGASRTFYRTRSAGGNTASSRFHP